MEDKTTISISKELWIKLNKLKEGPSDTFEDVVLKLIRTKLVIQNDNN